MSTAIAVLGTGPVATVYSGLHDGAPVAVKVFPGKIARRTLSAFEREQKTLRAKDVPSVARFYGVEQLSDGRHAVRMELCAQSLAALVQRVGRLEPANVVLLGHAAATSLAAAHAAGIVHGGVNPNNVLFRANGEPVLADFGVTLRHAFARDPLQSVESLPPETLRDDILDQRTDLYGLGVVLHVALTGRSPHPGRLGEHLGERVLRVLGEPVPAINLPGVSVELSTVVARLLAANPAHRPPNALVVAEQLSTMLAHRRPMAAPPQPSPPVPPQQPPAQPVVDEPPDEPTVQRVPVDERSGDADDFGDSGDFDDFAASRPAPEPHAWSTVDNEAPEPEPKRRPGKYQLFIGAGAIVVLVAVAVIMLLQSDPPELTTTPRMPPAADPSPTSTAPGVLVDLLQPDDLGNQVQLTWRSNPETLDFAVVVSQQNAPTTTVIAQRNHTIKIPVDANPARSYCFQVEATNSDAADKRVYQSQARAIRGGTCHH